MDQQLEQLVREAKQHSLQSEAGQKVLSKLVDEILRSRKICRYVSQPLSGVYLETYQLLQQQLLGDIEQSLDQDNPPQEGVREWANQMRQNVFRKVLNDTQLKKIALEAQRHPANTKLRQQALIELVNAIVLSSRLCHPHRWITPNDFYELIYEEAVNQTLVYVCQKLDNYDPTRGREQKFTNWVNFRLDKIMLNCHAKLQKTSYQEIPNLAELENIAQPEPQVSQTELLKQCLEDDVNNMFKNECIRNFPKANFRAIALATFSGKSWEEISLEMDVKISTLSSFFQRSCKKFAPQFKEYF
jgi:DNA-directed RNA polymerase specialized sigma24 family protein